MTSMPAAGLLAMLLVAGSGPAVGAGQVEVRIEGGASYLPLESWEDFFGDQVAGYYVEDSVAPFIGVSVGYRVREKHVVSIGTGRWASKPSQYSVSIGTGPSGELTGPVWENFIDWTLSTIPVLASYEYRAFGSRRWSPFVGVGGGYHFSKIHATARMDPPFEETPGTYEAEHTGEGYGVYADAGVRFPLGSTWGLQPGVRYRYSDGMAFTDEDGSIAVEFTGVDFMLRIDMAPGE